MLTDYHLHLRQDTPGTDAETYFSAAFDNVVNFVQGRPTNIVNPEALRVLR